MGKTVFIDKTTKQAILDVAEQLLKHGQINLGWNDIKDFLEKDGAALISFGSGRGPNRVFKAYEDAMASSRSANTPKTPTKVLFHLTGPETLCLEEATAVIDMIKTTWLSIEPIYGVAHDSSLTDEVRILLLTTR